jgi:hypothetical protein
MQSSLYCHVYEVTIDGVLDWIFDVLTTYTRLETTSNDNAIAILCNS